MKISKVYIMIYYLGEKSDKEFDELISQVLNSNYVREKKKTF